MTRREFAGAATGMIAGLLGSSAEAFAAEPPGNRGQAISQRILLKGGVVLTFDANISDFEKADVLIEGKKIVAVQPNISATVIRVLSVTSRQTGCLRTTRATSWAKRRRSTGPRTLTSGS